MELIKKYPEHPIIIKGYADELTQVWTNLIHNSIQAMNYKGELTIELVDGDQAYTQINIQDNGPGIPEEIREKIFQPFFTTKPMGEGSGLGLDIIQRIVDKHQGRIELETTVGVGTTFKVFLKRSNSNRD